MSERITPREKEVIQWLSVGKTADEVGVILGCARKTVETHKMHAMDKLGSANVVSMVADALRKQIIE